MATELDLPELDGWTYESLLSHLTSAIPRLTDRWTDFNPSDPGITLLQLLSWIGDVTLYRLNRIPDGVYASFLELLAGASGADVDRRRREAEADVVKVNGRTVYLGGASVPYDPRYVALLRTLAAARAGGASVHDVRTKALEYWNRPYRAVTTEDIEVLAVEATSGVPASVPEQRIARAVAVPSGDRIRTFIVSERRRSYSSLKFDDGDALSAVVVSVQSAYEDAIARGYDALEMAVKAYLDRRKVLGTVLTVERAPLSPLELEVDFASVGPEDPASVVARVVDAILNFVDPVRGGTDGAGWPFDRRVTEEALSAFVGRVEGVDRRQPVAVRAVDVYSQPFERLRLGAASYIAPVPRRWGFPLIILMRVRALANTWPLRVGVTSRVGVDTRLSRDPSAGGTS